MKRHLLYLAIVLTAGALGGCGADVNECEDTVVRVAITNGMSSAEYLALPKKLENAVLAIEAAFDFDSRMERCSGALIAPRWVVTAKHCVREQHEPALRVLAGANPTTASSHSVVAVFFHPELDVMLLELEAPLSDVVPFGLPDEDVTGAGELVQLGGFGRNEEGAFGYRSFLVAEVLEETRAELTVWAGGLGGACFGDSGGPVLARDGRGRVVVAGLLRSGSANCFGKDVYIKLAPVAAWLEQHTDYRTDNDASAESSLTATGRCYGSVAIWGQGDKTYRTSCAACGWNREAEGFRCVDGGDDPCEGVDDLGECRGSVLLRCATGRLLEWNCGDCGASCARSPRTGSAICVAR